MIKKVMLILMIFIAVNAYSNEKMIRGEVKDWIPESVKGLDEIGDSKSEYFDISSFYHSETKLKNNFRVTFNNVYSETNEKIKLSDKVEELILIIDVKTENKKESYQIIFADEKLVCNSNDKKIIGDFFISDLYNTIEMQIDKEYSEYNFDKSSSVHKNKIVKEYKIEVKENGKTTDFLLCDGKNKRGGNAAFVHHGNQGLTYTDVFRGPNNDADAGFDEILEEHQLYNIPGNFHLSGTLITAADWHDSAFLDWLKEGAAQGYVSMMTSAYAQHIMPFVNNDMNNWSVYIETELIKYKLNYTPRSAWIPERVWLSQGDYPNNGVIDWLGDNFTQYGINSVVLDDNVHCSNIPYGKIGNMNNGSGIDLKMVPRNDEFSGNVKGNPDAAKNQLSYAGGDQILVYADDWEIAASLNEFNYDHAFTWNYRNMINWCASNYPAVNVWKLNNAVENSSFLSGGADINKGTYNLIGGFEGYGGSNNAWYTHWASYSSPSDHHNPKSNFGYIWSDAYNNLSTAPDNKLSQAGWYVLMTNLYETGWHDGLGGPLSGWQIRYSAHIKNANPYIYASRWAAGTSFTEDVFAGNWDMDNDGQDEFIIYNQKIFMVFESIGGKINWMFVKDDEGNASSVIGNCNVYWVDTDGDWNDSSSKNHIAGLSDVSPNYQHDYYDWEVVESNSNYVEVEFSKYDIKKRVKLQKNKKYAEIVYQTDGNTYIQSGFTPDLVDLIWDTDHFYRLWDPEGKYFGAVNSNSDIGIAYVTGNGGASHNSQMTTTLLSIDEIKGYKSFRFYLYGGSMSEPDGLGEVSELETLSQENLDDFPPELYSPASFIDENKFKLNFSEPINTNTLTAGSISFSDFTGLYSVSLIDFDNNDYTAYVTINGEFILGDQGKITLTGVEDKNGNLISEENNWANLSIPNEYTPHTIIIDGENDFYPPSEFIETNGTDNFYFTWDSENIYFGIYGYDLDTRDLFIAFDTDQTSESGASAGSWGRTSFDGNFMPEYEAAVENGGSIQINYWTSAKGWNYPGNAGASLYGGWSGNLFTEIKIPWSAIGNPSGISFAVYLTEEDNLNTTNVFPDINDIGENIKISNYYKLYEPFVNGDLPLEWYNPSNVQSTNSKPVITSLSIEKGEYKDPLILSAVSSDYDTADSLLSLDFRYTLLNKSDTVNICTIDPENSYTWNSQLNSIILLQGRVYDGKDWSEYYSVDSVLMDNLPPVTSDDVPLYWQNSDFLVKFSSDDSLGSGFDSSGETYYSTDGTASLDSTGTVFHVIQEGEYVIKYRSIDDVGNLEEIKTAENTAKLDKTKPSLTDVQSNNISSNDSDNLVIEAQVTENLSGLNGSPQISILYPDSSEFTEFIDMSSQKKGVWSYVIEPPSMDWTEFSGDSIFWKITAKDNAGNFVLSINYYEIIEEDIDLYFIDLLPLDNNFEINEDSTMHFFASLYCSSDSLEISWFIDGEELKIYSESELDFYFNYSSSGIHEVKVRAEVVSSIIKKSKIYIQNVWSVNVLNKNRKPEIISHQPDTLAIVIDEGETISFAVTAEDPDQDSLIYKWYFDSAVIGSEDSYSWEIDYDMQGMHKVSVSVSDGEHSDSTEWIISVADVEVFPEISIIPEEVIFPETETGSQSIKVLQIINSGLGDFNVTDITLDSEVFSFEQFEKVEDMLIPGLGRDSIKITFNPLIEMDSIYVDTLRIVSEELEDIEIRIQGESVYIPPQYSVQGQVTYFSGNWGLQNTSLYLTGNISADTLTDSAGNYEFYGLMSGDIEIYPVYEDSSIAGINALDYIRIKKHSLGIDLIPVGTNTFTAADVSGDESINALDYIKIKRRILGLDSGFSIGNWVFVPGSLSYTIESDVENADFIGIKIGDVNGSYSQSVKRYKR